MSLQALIEKIRKELPGQGCELLDEVLRVCDSAEELNTGMENLRIASKINGPKMDKMIVRNVTGMTLKNVDELCKE